MHRGSLVVLLQRDRYQIRRGEFPLDDALAVHEAAIQLDVVRGTEGVHDIQKAMGDGLLRAVRQWAGIREVGRLNTVFLCSRRDPHLIRTIQDVFVVAIGLLRQIHDVHLDRRPDRTLR